MNTNPNSSTLVRLSALALISCIHLKLHSRLICRFDAYMALLIPDRGVLNFAYCGEVYVSNFALQKFNFSAFFLFCIVMTFVGLALSPMLGTFNAFIAWWHSSKQIIEQTLWKDLNKLRSWCYELMIL